MSDHEHRSSNIFLQMEAELERLRAEVERLTKELANARGWLKQGDRDRAEEASERRERLERLGRHG